MTAKEQIQAALADELLRNGERQVSPTLDGIRRDHVARYEFANKVMASDALAPQSVLDLACGVGYGAYIMAKSGHKVFALDRSVEAIAYARRHYTCDEMFQNPLFKVVEATSDWSANFAKDQFGCITCFETLEHIKEPAVLLRQMSRVSKTLIASVPNEKVFPHKGKILFHYRHYTKAQFKILLNESGWDVTHWAGQEGPHSEAVYGRAAANLGRTMIAVCVRKEHTHSHYKASLKAAKPSSVKALTKPAPDQVAAPKRVTILGLGPSLERYVDYVKRLGGRKAFTDEVWAINALGDVIQCDRVFQMDDVRVQEARARLVPKSNISTMLDWMKTHKGPIYTSQLVEGYSGLVEFPLEDVINSTGQGYFNSTAAYAVAYAVHIGVEEINLFGCDFSYPNAYHAEKGRACVEFWLGMASARGIRIGVPDNTSLLDTIEGHDAHFYGYDAVKVVLDIQPGHTKVTFEPKELPTAEQVEARYNHSKHPNPHMSGETQG